MGRTSWTGKGFVIGVGLDVSSFQTELVDSPNIFAQTKTATVASLPHSTSTFSAVDTECVFFFSSLANIEHHKRVLVFALVNYKSLSHYNLIWYLPEITSMPARARKWKCQNQVSTMVFVMC